VLGRSLQGQGELQRKGSRRGVGRSVVRGGVSAVRRSSQMHGSRHRQASGTKSTQRHRETDRELGVGKDRDFVTVAGGGGSCPAHPSACSSRCPGQWASGACTGPTQPSLAATPAPARGWAHRWPRACSRCERPPVCLCAPVAPPWWAAASATAATAAAWRTQASGRPRRHTNQTAGSGALTLSALAKCSEGDWPRHAAGPRASWAASSTRPAVRCAARIAVLWCRRGRCGALILSHAWIGLAVGSASASEIGSSAQLLAVAAN
jgi:hypothetical protein